MPEDKNYIGSGWESANGQHINISVNLEKLNRLPTNQYGEVRLTVTKRKEPHPTSKATHFVVENTYQK